MDPSTTVSPLQQILADIGTIITAAIGWIGDLLSFVKDQPLLLIPIGLSFAAVVIGLFYKLKD